MYTRTELVGTWPRAKACSCPPNPIWGWILISATSPFRMSRTARSRPGTTMSSSLVHTLGSSWHFSTSVPSARHRVYLAVIVEPSLGFSYPSPSLNCFLTTIPSLPGTSDTFRQDWTSTSRVNDSLGPNFSPYPSSAKPYRGLTSHVTRSPFCMVVTTLASAGQKKPSPTTKSAPSSPLSSNTVPSAFLAVKTTCTSSFSRGFSHPEPSARTFLMMPPSPEISLTLFQCRSSISNTSVASGGMVGGAPDSPYAYGAVHVTVDFSPFFIVATALSHPLITAPMPSLKLNSCPRSRLESN
mmetsp:Transcript_9417/g.34557  ORF Transcript_9417/g.34557 Transcript_9417/m.34557 type:complete len:298 (-) Transcript_9417:329-1222(-)